MSIEGVINRTILHRLRREGPRPRVHGNGFIQLDVDEVHRLHIWGHPDIPKQKVSTPIHDHVFGFTSICLVGRLVNVTYSIDRCPNGNFQICSPRVREGEDTVLEMTGARCWVDQDDCDMILSSSPADDDREYTMKPFMFHETFAPEPTATLIKKTGPTQAQGAKTLPRVLVPHGVEPDNEFNRYDASPDDLWAIIYEVMSC